MITDFRFTAKCLLRSVLSVQNGIMHISGTNVFVGIVVEYVMRVKAVLSRRFGSTKITEFKNWSSGM